MTEAPIYFARRCDLTGRGVNQGYVWRLGGVITALGKPSERQARLYGFKSLAQAENEGAAKFKAWTDADDILYQSTDGGELCTMDGRKVETIHRDSLDHLAQLACSSLNSKDLAALVKCLAFGAQVMRERAERASDHEKGQYTDESKRASTITARILSLSVTSEDWR
jgi:hypothetical protein